MGKDLRKKLCLMIFTLGAVLTLTGCFGSKKEAVEKEIEAIAAVRAAGVEAQAAAPADTKGSGVQAASESGSEETTSTAAAETKKAAGKDESIRVMTGTVKDAGTSTVTVVSERYPDGVIFSKEDAVTQFENGLLLDQEITLFYLGEIKNGNASEVTVQFIRDKRDKDSECQAAMISGKVVSVGMSAITIETEDGKSISFEQDPKPVNLTGGPLEGDTVTILYSYHDEGGDGAVVPELIR